MAYSATIIPVMIASPGDVVKERDVARDVISEWNYVNSLSTKVMLSPVGWETHAAPELNGRAQELINERVLKDCDLLVGIFWTRLGTPTGIYPSGSVEEIQRHIEGGKPAMIYFSSAPVVPQSINAEQFEALKVFRGWCEGRGLIESFENIQDFQNKFTRQLHLQLNNNPYLHKIRQSVSTSGASGTVTVAPFDAPPVEGFTFSLSEETRSLLIAAADDPNGMIIKSETIGGTRIGAGQKSFGDPKDRRSVARWEHAIDQLTSAGLIENRGRPGIFVVTQRGFELADKLKAS
jgi:hypothetical protein